MDVALAAEVEDRVTSERLEANENVASTEQVVAPHHLRRHQQTRSVGATHRQ
jgi:hypothetical protein